MSIDIIKGLVLFCYFVKNYVSGNVINNSKLLVIKVSFKVSNMVLSVDVLKNFVSIFSYWCLM